LVWTKQSQLYLSLCIQSSDKMSDTGMKWYVLRTISGQEHKTKTYIENEMAHAGMSDLVGRIVIPMEKVVQVRNGKKSH